MKHQHAQAEHLAWSVYFLLKSGKQMSPTQADSAVSVLEIAVDLMGSDYPDADAVSDTKALIEKLKGHNGQAIKGKTLKSWLPALYYL